MIFLDTNIWLYGYIDEDDAKHHKAIELVRLSGVVLSSQVINEIAVNLLRMKLMDEKSIRELASQLYSNYHVVEIREQDILHASSLRESHRFSYWDSLIVGSALRAGAQILYSEDMQHQLVVDGKLQIFNPFL